jgi:Abnormal spindle-like microcephaly-assoc'd, ASPM-SPD-2-Hydin
MYQGDLLNSPLRLQTEYAMQRLPQPSSKSSLFVFVVFGALMLVAFLQASAAVNQLSFNPAALRFGEVIVGRKATLAAVITNNGSSSITLSTISVNGATYSVSGLPLPVSLGAGQSVSFTVTFSPTATGLASASIAFNGNAAHLSLGGWGVSSQSLTSNPPNLAFGDVQTGSTETLHVTVTNSEATSISISQQSPSAGFATTNLSLPLTLAPGDSYTFGIVFSPSSTGAVSGMFRGLSSGNGVLIGIPLTGTGTAAGQLTISPASINFGNVTVGTSSTKTGTLAATGASVTISSADSSSSEFVLSGMSFPSTIAAGQSASYSMTFTPQSSGAASATLSFVSNASNSPTVQSLSGTGVVPQQYSVSLSWDASTSPVVGYNVYRGSKSGGRYARINTILDPKTTYVDSNVAASQTYYYVTTSVNSSGQESAYSNQVKVVIP